MDPSASDVRGRRIRVEGRSHSELASGAVESSPGFFRPPRWILGAVVAATVVMTLARVATAIPVDSQGTINLSVRAYLNARVSTVATQSTRPSNPGSFGGT